jgi:preprotein translocase SecE subunit
MTTHAITAKPAGNRFTRFFSGIWGELKKVVWLSRKEAAYLTMIVLVVSVIAGVVLYGCDYGFSTLIDKFIIK